DLVEDRTQLAKYYLTAAQLCDRQLNRRDEAIDYYELALEHDPTMAKALEGLATLRTDKQDWTGLQQSYKKVLTRLPESSPKEAVAKIHALLGELYEKRLKQPGEAIAAYEKAMEVAPAEHDYSEKLAELYLTDGKRYYDKAIAA